MSNFLTVLLYLVWMTLGYVLWGITGVILFFIFIFVFIRMFTDMVKRDMYDGLNNSGRNKKHPVLDPNFPEDDWDD